MGRSVRQICPTGEKTQWQAVLVHDAFPKKKKQLFSRVEGVPIQVYNRVGPLQRIWPIKTNSINTISYRSSDRGMWGAAGTNWV